MSDSVAGKAAPTLSEDNTFAYSFLPGVLFVALLWLISLLAYLTQADLVWLGVLPRNFFGLIGIVTGPLIHSGLLHLLSNTFPLVLLSGFVLFLHRRAGLRVLVLVYVLSGALTWLIGRQAYHVGASGIVYGLAGFLLFNGFLRRNRGAMAVSLAVLFLYGGLFYGLFPNEERVSWEGHLAGLAAGLVAAIMYGERAADTRQAFVVEPGVAQRHMSNTLGAGYYHFYISYTLQRPDAGQQFYYTLRPPAAGEPTPQVPLSSKRKKAQTHGRETKGN